MLAYIYAADVYCEECGRTIRERIASERNAPEDPDDESSYDSGEYPKGPFDEAGEESDTPQHCGSGAGCINAETCDNGTVVGCFLENPLTQDGYEYVKEQHRDSPSDVTGRWLDFYEIKEVDCWRGVRPEELDEFTQAYIEAALWSSMDESDENTGGEPMDKNYDASDIDADTLAQMAADCAAFQNFEPGIREMIAQDESQAGHDFWLTRNHHGAGFWDGDWDDNLPESFEPSLKGVSTSNVGDYLTEVAHTFGNFDLYIGDDDKVHGS